MSKKCVRKLVEDSIHLHDIEKLVLFTTQNNVASQKVYGAVGFKKCGFYGMYFGK